MNQPVPIINALRSLLLLTLFAAFPLSGEAYGQAESQEDAKSVEIIKLQHIKAQWAVEALDEFLGESHDMHLVADERSNSVLFLGDDKAEKRVLAFLTQVDLEEANVGDAATVRLYYLENVKAEMAGDIIASIVQGMDGARLAIDPRLNSVLLSGDEKLHSTVENILKVIDRPASLEGEQVTVTKSAAEMGKGAQHAALAKTLASSKDVQFELIPELDVMILKGTKANIVGFQKDLEHAVEITQDNTDAKTLATNYSVRISWLISGAKSADTEDEPSELDAVRKQAAKYGFKNLQYAGQLLATTSVNAGNESQFSVSGDIALPSDKYEGGPVVSIKAKGTLALVDAKKDRLSLGVSVDAAGCQTDVNIQLAAGNPVIIAAMPIDSVLRKETQGSPHSLFLVEVIKHE